MVNFMFLVNLLKYEICYSCYTAKCKLRLKAVAIAIMCPVFI